MVVHVVRGRDEVTEQPGVLRRDDAQGVLDAADHWLYEAKHHGRNQVQPVTVVPA